VYAFVCKIINCLFRLTFRRQPTTCHTIESEHMIIYLQEVGIIMKPIPFSIGLSSILLLLFEDRKLEMGSFYRNFY